jgi:hypothetical protein
MKKTITTLNVILGLFAGYVLTTSCNAVKDAVPAQTVGFSGASADVIIPATSDTTQQVEWNAASVTYNIDSLIKDKTGGALGFANIDTVKLTNITLSLSDADADNNFGNFQNAATAFNTNINTTPYTLANITNNPSSYSTSLTLPLIDKNKNLRPYFGSGMTFGYILLGKLRKATTKPLHCHIAVSYDISVKL